MSEQATQLARFKAAQNTTVNDFTRRLGYSGGAPHLTIPPRFSGLSSASVPGGKLLLFSPQKEYRHGQFDEMTGTRPMVPHVVPPTELQGAVRRKFHEIYDCGYRDLDCLRELPYNVTDDAYTDDAPKYFNTVHPRLECSFGLEAVYRTGTEGNVGAEWFQACPTCRLKSLKSDDLTKRIATSGLNQDILNELRAKLIESCEATIFFVERKVDLINADLEKRAHGEPQGRTSRNEVDYIHLKMLHRSLEKKAAPQEDITETIARVVANTMTAMEAAKQEDPDRAEFEKWKLAQNKPKKKKDETEE